MSRGRSDPIKQSPPPTYCHSSSNVRDTNQHGGYDYYSSSNKGSSRAAASSFHLFAGTSHRRPRTSGRPALQLVSRAGALLVVLWLVHWGRSVQPSPNAVQLPALRPEQQQQLQRSATSLGASSSRGASLARLASEVVAQQQQLAGAADTAPWTEAPALSSSSSGGSGHSGSDGDSKPDDSLLQLAARGHTGEGYVAICASLKDQQLDVREWVTYHHMIGVERFYIIDPGSSPPLVDVLRDHVASGLVHYTWGVPEGVKPKAGARGPQTAIYDWCLGRHGPKHEWMAFIDGDEFLVLRDPAVPDLPALLRQYEGYGGLVANWQMFGSSGHESRPATNTLLAYTACLPPNHPDNCHVKSIVRPVRTRESHGTPHGFLYHQPWYAVNTRGERIDMVRTDEAGIPVALDRLALHHYVTKSLYDYWLKRARGTGMGNTKDLYYFNMINSLANHTCLEACSAGQRLQSLLAADQSVQGAASSALA